MLREACPVHHDVSGIVPGQCPTRHRPRLRLPRARLPESQASSTLRNMLFLSLHKTFFATFYIEPYPGSPSGVSWFMLSSTDAFDSRYDSDYTSSQYQTKRVYSLQVLKRSMKSITKRQSGAFEPARPRDVVLSHAFCLCMLPGNTESPVSASEHIPAALPAFGGVRAEGRTVSGLQTSYDPFQGSATGRALWSALLLRCFYVVSSTLL